MGSEFRKRKVLFLFSFFDKDSNNLIEKEDFENSAKYSAEARGWQPGDAKYKENEERLLQVWDSLQKHADKDNDGKISLEEWISMWEDFAKDPSSPLEWQRLYCKLIFDIQDASGDGAIDAEEFSSVCASFGDDKAGAVKAFEKMAEGQSKITWEQFQELWNEFFSTDDPDAPGNLIFGSRPI